VVADVAWQLVQLGCEEISLGDTIGVGTPDTTRAMLTAVLERIPADRLAGHFHDTSGNALLNIYTALELGLSTFDSSVTGLGGCPFAPGASGNVATEEVIHLLQSQGIETGVDLEKLLAAGEFIRAALGKPAQSHLGEIHPARPN
jgi:isopropylmalate/homocitrate/citramalate synthase